MQHSILIVDDNEENLSLLRSILNQDGYNIFPANSVDYGASLLKKNRGKFSVALIDHHMPGMQGDAAIQLYKTIDTDLQFLTITGDTSEEVLQKSMSAGSALVFDRNMKEETLRSVVRRYCKQFEDRSRIVSAASVEASEMEQVIRQYGMIGRSEHLHSVCKLISSYATSDDVVLIRGENGTGKERIARAIHNHSLVSDGPFIAVNCGAISEGISESELFGHIRGAFTGAMKDRMGHFREANGGTLFLDEIGDMPPLLQTKLLRVLQEKEIVPVGASKPVKVNVRIIAATNVDLDANVKNGKFREDLFYRLNVLPIQILPLRERKDDIEPLILHFEEKWRKKTGLPQKQFRVRTIKALKSDSWPGNIRELESIVSRVLTRVQGQVIEREDLDERFQVFTDDDVDYSESFTGLHARHEREERDFFSRLLKKTGSLSASARALNMPKATLHNRLKYLGIKI